jgi:hypothetical protein
MVVSASYCSLGLRILEEISLASRIPKVDQTFPGTVHTFLGLGDYQACSSLAR